MNEALREIAQRSKSFEEADFLPTLLGPHHHDVMNDGMPVVLFGAGTAGIRLCRGLEIHRIPISCFCDNNSEIVGSRCAGYPVISVEELSRDHRDSLIVITVSSHYTQQIHAQLLGLGFSSDKVHTLPLDPMIYYTNVAKLYWPPEDLQTHAQQLQNAYNLFADRKSKDLFIHRLALLTGGFDYRSFQTFIDEFADFHTAHGPNLFSGPLFDENYFYFHSDFFPLKEGEVFANVGALLGDCAIEFANVCREKNLAYKGIINFEPDPNNFAKLSANMANLPNVRCFPYGLWSGRSRLRFSNPAQSGAGVPGWLDVNGDLEVDVVSLDELLPDLEITLMKMDVEGAEMEALKGAAETIRRNRPKLAISLYHKRDDIFEIPLYIHELYSGYQFYLRHYSTTFSETVLFAIDGQP